jgi:APA family basic amino acid/polyamine antiporter
MPRRIAEAGGTRMSGTAARKELGFWTCTALVIGNTIGMGIFLLPASLAPYGLNALLGWGVTVVGMTLLAWVYAHLARRYPEADGPYAYLRVTVGEAAAFIAIWCYWVSLWITNATIAIGLVGYLGTLWPALAGPPPAVVALGVVWVFVLVNLMGVRAGGGVQLATTALKLLPMAAVILLGGWLALHEPEAYTRHPPAVPLSWAALLPASSIALYAMLGIESAAVPAGRVHDPERTIPRATIVGTLLTAVIYVLVSAVPLLLIPAAELANSTAPFVDVLARTGGGAYGRWMALFVAISGLGCVNGWTLLTGELTASMAGHGMLPAGLGRRNRRAAPARALLVTAVLASLMVLMNYDRSLVQGFTFLTQLVTAANLPLYLLCALALVVPWWRGARRARDAALLVGLLGSAYAVFAFVGVGGEAVLWSAVLALAGVPLYLRLRRQRLRAAA